MKKRMKSKNNCIQLLTRKSQVVFIYSFLIVLIIVASLLDATFFTIPNYFSLMRYALPLLLTTAAQTIIIILGGVDLSVGAIMSMANVMVASLISKGDIGWGLPLIIALAIGFCAGLLNGVLVTKGKLQPIITTLATTSLYTGFCLIIMDNPGAGTKSEFYKFITRGASNLMPTILMIVFVIAIWFLLNRTLFGRSIYAIGGNELSARATGIKVNKIKIFAFALSGLFAAFAGVYSAALLSSGDPMVGNQYVERSITAAVIGGTSLSGGSGGIIGGIAGVFIIYIINNILNLIGMSTFYQYIFQGGLLILALAISSIKARK